MLSFDQTIGKYHDDVFSEVLGSCYRFTLHVAGVGLKLLVDSWNEHPIPGKHSITVLYIAQSVCKTTHNLIELSYFEVNSTCLS